MAILGPLFDSNNGWYIVTTGEDGQKKKVTFSSPLDYYVSMGVMPIIGPEYIDLEDVDSEVDSDEEMVQGEELVQYEQSPEFIAEMEDTMLVDDMVFYSNLACINKQFEEALAAADPSNFTNTEPLMTSSASDSTMYFPSPKKAFPPCGN